MLRVKSLCGIVAAALLLSGCSWLGRTPPEQSVRVLSAADVGTCRMMGQTTVSLVDKLDAVSDNPAKVQQALNLLARRSAVTLGGDVVVPLGDAKAGQQTFDIYACGTH